MPVVHSSWIELQCLAGDAAGTTCLAEHRLVFGFIRMIGGGKRCNNEKNTERTSCYQHSFFRILISPCSGKRHVLTLQTALAGAVSLRIFFIVTIPIKRFL